MSIMYKYLDKRAAAIAAIKDFDSMRFIINNTDSEIAAERAKMIGALVGSISVILLRNGLIILGVNERVIEGIQGIVLLVIVFLTYVKNKDGIWQ